MSLTLLTSQQPAEALALGTTWARAGDPVTVVLLDSATMVLRPGHAVAPHVETAQAAGVQIWAHHDAVRERVLPDPAVDVQLVDLDAVAALVADPTRRVQWW